MDEDEVMLRFFYNIPTHMYGPILRHHLLIKNLPSDTTPRNLSLWIKDVLWRYFHVIFSLEKIESKISVSNEGSVTGECKIVGHNPMVDYSKRILMRITEGDFTFQFVPIQTQSGSHEGLNISPIAPEIHVTAQQPETYYPNDEDDNLGLNAANGESQGNANGSSSQNIVQDGSQGQGGSQLDLLLGSLRNSQIERLFGATSQPNAQAPLAPEPTAAPVNFMNILSNVPLDIIRESLMDDPHFRPLILEIRHGLKIDEDPILAHVAKDTVEHRYKLFFKESQKLYQSDWTDCPSESEYMRKERKCINTECNGKLSLVEWDGIQSYHSTAHKENCLDLFMSKKNGGVWIAKDTVLEEKRTDFENKYYPEFSKHATELPHYVDENGYSYYRHSDTSVKTTVTRMVCYGAVDPKMSRTKGKELSCSVVFRMKNVGNAVRVEVRLCKVGIKFVEPSHGHSTEMAYKRKFSSPLEAIVYDRPDRFDIRDIPNKVYKWPENSAKNPSRGLIYTKHILTEEPEVHSHMNKKENKKKGLIDQYGFRYFQSDSTNNVRTFYCYNCTGKLKVVINPDNSRTWKFYPHDASKLCRPAGNTIWKAVETGDVKFIDYKGTRLRTSDHSTGLKVFYNGAIYRLHAPGQSRQTLTFHCSKHHLSSCQSVLRVFKLGHELAWEAKASLVNDNDVEYAQTPHSHETNEDLAEYKLVEYDSTSSSPTLKSVYELEDAMPTNLPSLNFNILENQTSDPYSQPFNDPASQAQSCSQRSVTNIEAMNEADSDFIFGSQRELLDDSFDEGSDEEFGQAMIVPGKTRKEYRGLKYHLNVLKNLYDPENKHHEITDALPKFISECNTLNQQRFQLISDKEECSKINFSKVPEHERTIGWDPHLNTLMCRASTKSKWVYMCTEDNCQARGNPLTGRCKSHSLGLCYVLLYILFKNRMDDPERIFVYTTLVVRNYEDGSNHEVTDEEFRRILRRNSDLAEIFSRNNFGVEIITKKYWCFDYETQEEAAKEMYTNLQVTCFIRSNLERDEGRYQFLRQNLRIYYIRPSLCQMLEKAGVIINLFNLEQYVKYKLMERVSEEESMRKFGQLMEAFNSDRHDKPTHIPREVLDSVKRLCFNCEVGEEKNHHIIYGIYGLVRKLIYHGLRLFPEVGQIVASLHKNPRTDQTSIGSYRLENSIGPNKSNKIRDGDEFVHLRVGKADDARAYEGLVVLADILAITYTSTFRRNGLINHFLPAVRLSPMDWNVLKTLIGRDFKRLLYYCFKDEGEFIAF